VRGSPVLVIVLVLVLNRWMEMTTGWPEAVVFPLVALAGTLLVDRLVLPAGSRLGWRAWTLNGAAAAGLGGLLWVLAR
jgi:hypothetical protein